MYEFHFIFHIENDGKDHLFTKKQLNRATETMKLGRVPIIGGIHGHDERGNIRKSGGNAGNLLQLPKKR